REPSRQSRGRAEAAEAALPAPAAAPIQQRQRRRNWMPVREETLPVAALFRWRHSHSLAFAFWHSGLPEYTLYLSTVRLLQWHAHTGRRFSSTTTTGCAESLLLSFPPFCTLLPFGWSSGYCCCCCCCRFYRFSRFGFVCLRV